MDSDRATLIAALHSAEASALDAIEQPAPREPDENWTSFVEHQKALAATYRRLAEKLEGESGPVFHVAPLT